MVMTLDIPDAVVEKAKKLAEDRNATLSVIFSEGVEALAAESAPTESNWIERYARKFGEVNPAVDLSSNASIYDFFDQEDAEKHGLTRR